MCRIRLGMTLVLVGCSARDATAPAVDPVAPPVAGSGAPSVAPADAAPLDAAPSIDAAVRVPFVLDPRGCPASALWLREVVGPLASSLFPACTGEQMQVAEPVCVGACPRPCELALTITRDDGTQIHQTTKLAYDGKGHLASIGDQSYVHDAAGRLVSLANPLALHELARDANDRIAAVVRRDRQSGDVDQRWTVGYDAAGRVASLTLDMRTITLEYDASGRQVRQRDGGRVAKMAYDAKGRLITFGSETWSYDARGRLAQTKRNDNTKTLLFAYDDEDRLLRVELKPSPGGGWGSTTTYRYTCP